MPSFIVYAREANTMRADRRNSIIVNADDAEAARAAAEALIGPAAGALASFAVVNIASVMLCASSHHATVAPSNDLISSTFRAQP